MIGYMEKLVILAEGIATSAHRGQKRRFTHEPYINHPRRVSEYFPRDEDRDLQVIAWLHDVLEDTVLTEHDLHKGGIPIDLMRSVTALTRMVGETYYDFIMRVMRDVRARKVKIADINDNMRDLSPADRLWEKYRLALHILENE